jgi:hypothetical protein
MIRQFHEFFNLFFGGFLQYDPTVWRSTADSLLSSSSQLLSDSSQPSPCFPPRLCNRVQVKGKRKTTNITSVKMANPSNSKVSLHKSYLSMRLLTHLRLPLISCQSTGHL